MEDAIAENTNPGNWKAAFHSMGLAIWIFLLSGLWMFSIGTEYYSRPEPIFEKMNAFLGILLSVSMFGPHLSFVATMFLFLGGLLLFFKRWLLVSSVGIFLDYLSLILFLIWSSVVTFAAKDLAGFGSFIVFGFFFGIPVALLHRRLYVLSKRK